jgi:hypothetical protein
MPADNPPMMAAPSVMSVCPGNASDAATFIDRSEVVDYLSRVEGQEHGWNYSGPATTFAVTANVIQVDFEGGSTTAEPTPTGTVFTIWLRCGST